MLDYGTWPIKRLAVTGLLLDQQNPRLPQSSGALTQRQIIDELVTHDNVYDLAKDITTQGFFPTEILLGVRDGDQIVVVEGNRRLASLKLLINPELAPQAHLEKFRRLSELYWSCYQHSDHEEIARSLKLCGHSHWVVTYDDVSAIRKMYNSCQIRPFCLRYTAQRRRQGKELFIAPNRLVVPPKALAAFRYA